MEDVALYDGFEEEVPAGLRDEDREKEGEEEGGGDRRSNGRRRGVGKRKRKVPSEEKAPDLLTMEYEAYLESFRKIKSFLNDQMGKKRRGSRGGQRRVVQKRT